MTIGLYITIEPENGRPVTLARVADTEILRAAGQSAIARADREAQAMESEDPVLGILQRAEASRLRSALELVIPELRASLSLSVM